MKGNGFRERKASVAVSVNYSSKIKSYLFFFEKKTSAQENQDRRLKTKRKTNFKQVALIPNRFQVNLFIAV